jgi:hypothetical protein
MTSPVKLIEIVLPSSGVRRIRTGTPGSAARVREIKLECVAVTHWGWPDEERLNHPSLLLKTLSVSDTMVASATGLPSMSTTRPVIFGPIFPVVELEDLCVPAGVITTMLTGPGVASKVISGEFVYGEQDEKRKVKIINLRIIARFIGTQSF